MSDDLSISDSLAQDQQKRRKSFKDVIKLPSRKDKKEFLKRNEGEEEIKWQKSAASKNCTCCAKKFSLTTRKHHCR